jgi:acyl carrier protein
MPDNTEFELSMINLIAGRIGINSSMIKLQSSFSDLGADSLDVLDIIMEIESEFDIHILNEEADKCDTVKQLLDIVKPKIEK